MKQFWYDIKAWVQVNFPGVFEAPEIPEDELTVEELLEKFAPSDEEEWEDD